MGMQGLHYRLYVRPPINRLVGEGCSNTNYRIGSGVVCKGSGHGGQGPHQGLTGSAQIGSTFLSDCFDSTIKEIPSETKTWIREGLQSPSNGFGGSWGSSWDLKLPFPP